jgi:CheY-like chemotaxis protein
MSNDIEPVIIHMSDDDADDRLMLKEALQEVRVGNNVEFSEDGQELMDRLQSKGAYKHMKDKPLPGLILLDLNMPRKDGREALAEIKSDPKLKHIPVVILTTSRAEEDILRSYDLGGNSFITKPVTFEKLVEVLKTVTNYWLEIVKLPQQS